MVKTLVSCQFSFQSNESFTVFARKTAPHEGYEILNRWVEKLHYRDSQIAQQIRWGQSLHCILVL